jgi:hypothetical protein
VLLVEVTCDAGLWSRECLATVAEVTRAFAARAELVAGVESLAVRPRVVAEEGGGLALRPLAADLPDDARSLRRLRARASADYAFLRGVASANERAALIQVRLAPGATPAEVFGLVESLRESFHRPPAISLTGVSRGLCAHELARTARRDLAIVTPIALLALALVGGLAAGSARIGLALAALAAAALAWCAAALALLRVSLGPGAAVVPCLVCASVGAMGLALLHRIAGEQRAGRALGAAVTRALGTAGGPLAAAGLGGALAFAALAFGAEPRAQSLALAGAGGVTAALVAAGVGLPALLLAFSGSDSRRRALLAAGPLGGLADAMLARLDGALRAPSASRAARALSAVGLAAIAVLGARELEGEALATRFLARRTPISDAIDALRRDFGGTALVRVVVDSGAPGGAAEPLFLERVQELERLADEQASVGSVRSLVDAAVLPAMRASHDDDPGFAVIPPTREQVESAFDLFARSAPERLRDGVDTDLRRLAIDIVADSRDSRGLVALERALAARAAALFGREHALEFQSAELDEARASERMTKAALVTALAALTLVAALSSFAFESALAGALAALPAVPALLLLFGAMGSLGLRLDFATGALAVYVALAAAGAALLYLDRTRELAHSGAELHVAVSIALRDVGRPIAQGSLASVSFLALLASASPPLERLGALAFAGAIAAVGSTLVALPISVRALRPHFLLARFAPKVEETLSCVAPESSVNEE